MLGAELLGEEHAHFAATARAAADAGCRRLVFGPFQVEGRIDQDPTISAQFALWSQSGTRVIRGNLLVIPLGARLLTIADAYEAMTSSRPYRKTPLTHEQAVDQLTKFSGIQFDPDIVPILVNLDREILDRPPVGDDALFWQR